MRTRRFLLIAVLATSSVVCGCSDPPDSLSKSERHDVAPHSGLLFSLSETKSRPQSAGAFVGSERREIPIRLENRTGRVLRWVTIKSSCDCLEVKLPADHLGVGECMDGMVVIDLGHTPEFRGGLILSAEAWPADGGQPAFTLELLADVK